MKDAAAVNSYSININKKKYVFTCPDGEEHVREIEEKLIATIDSVSKQEQGHILSDYAVKVALVLTDDAICEKNGRTQQLSEIEEKILPLLQELDRVLGIHS